MTMIKNSSQNVPCTYCNKTAEGNTNPPVCKEHKDKLHKLASKDVKTLKELDVAMIKDSDGTDDIPTD